MIELSQASPAGAGYTVTSVWLSRGENPIISFCFCFCLKDSHFTVLGFTAANGAPVMCAVIFSAKELCEEWVIGYNASAQWIGDEAG
jgi:hypothetical protein